MPPEPLLSVIVPSYNTAHFLPECIGSVLAQTLTALELIVVDDGSTDDSSSILRMFEKRDSRVTALCLEHVGVADARNAALKIARGAFITFLDSDDIVPPSAYERLVSAAERHKAEIVTGIAESFNSNRRWVNPQMQEVRNNATCTTTLTDSPALARDASPCNKIISRALIERMELQFPAGIGIREDLHFVIRAYAAASRVTVLPDIVYHYRLRDDNGAQSQTQIMVPKVLFDLMWVHDDTLRRLPDALNGDVKEIFSQGIVGNIAHRLRHVVATQTPDEARDLLTTVSSFLKTLSSGVITSLTGADFVLASLLCAARVDSARLFCAVDSSLGMAEVIGAAGGQLGTGLVGALVDYQQRWIHRLQARVSLLEGRRRRFRKPAKVFARNRRSISGVLTPLLLVARTSIGPSRDSGERVWVVGERRGISAQDTGWSFFCYLQKNRPDVRSFFLTSSEVYASLESRENVLVFDTAPAIQKLRQAEAIIYSDCGLDLSPYWDRMVGRLNPNVVGCFLQHGIIALNGMRGFYNASSMRSRNDVLDVFVTSSRYEAQTVVDRLGHDKKAVKVTGLSRFDHLPTAPSTGRDILLMPTWRTWLRSTSGSAFYISEYFQRYASLVRSPRLSKLLADHDTRVVFCPHFAIAAQFAQLFSDIPRIRVVDSSVESLQNLVRDCGMLITDYSSVAFDFVYQHKPVLHYMFDRPKWRAVNGTVGVDFDRDLPGRALSSEDGLLDELERLVSGGMMASDEQEARGQRFFEFRDQNNCQRIAEAIEAAIALKTSGGFSNAK